MGDFLSGIAGFREALRRSERSEGPQSHSTLSLSANLAAGLILRGESDLFEAEHLLQHLKERQIERLGEGHPDITKTVALQAAATLKAGNHSSALVLFRGVVADLRESSGPYHNDVLLNEDNILTALLFELGVKPMESTFKNGEEGTWLFCVCFPMNNRGSFR